MQTNMPFMQRSYIFSIFNLGTAKVLFVNNRLYCADKASAKAISLLDKGLILDKPYFYEMKAMETMADVSKKFHVLEETLYKWNPHAKNGYAKGTLLKLYWVLP